MYFQWSYAGQPGVPWKALATKGTNSGSNATYTYTDWQTVDIPLDTSVVKSGDHIQLIVLAAGCSPGGHDGHIYLDEVTTGSASGGLEITVTGDTTTNPGGPICYTYKYNYTGSSTNNIVVQAHMPQSQNSPVPYDTIYTSHTQPSTSGGNCSFDAQKNVLDCNLGNAVNNLSGTFTMCVLVPSDWPSSYGPINNGNYPISSADLNPVLGNLWQTNMTSVPPIPPSQPHSYLVVDPTGLYINGQDPSLNDGNVYLPPHFYTCTNQTPMASDDALDATCNITNLPDGFSVSNCTISPIAAAWTQPAAIPKGETVTCYVTGTANSSISREYDALITSEAPNNTNSITNKAIVPFYIYNDPQIIPATLDGSPVITPIKVCCGRPVRLGDLDIPSDLQATYRVVSSSPNVACLVDKTARGVYYVKAFGQGMCTIQGKKDGEISEPLLLDTQ